MLLGAESAGYEGRKVTEDMTDAMSGVTVQVMPDGGRVLSGTPQKGGESGSPQKTAIFVTFQN